MSFQSNHDEQEESIFSRVFDLLTAPHETVVGTRKKQQIRLFSSLLIAAIPFFVYAIIFTNIVPDIRPILVVALFLVFISYILSRTKFCIHALYFALTLITILPSAVYLFFVGWVPNDLPRIIIWLPVALIAGGLLTRPKIVLAQSITISLIMFVGIASSGFGFFDVAPHIGAMVIIMILILISSYMLERTLHKLVDISQDTERRRLELEVYAQLLRHDLRNDLQAIIGSIELADILLDVNVDMARSHIDRCLAIGDSMVNLLSIFTLDEETPATNLVDLIQGIAVSAETSYPHLMIEVQSTQEARERVFTASRLLPMVWTDLFRNAAQYAGSSPRMTVHISIENDEYEIVVEDDGPGIPEHEKPWIFKRGKEAGSGDRGLGLYLTSVIIKSQGGSIDIADSESKSGAKFVIRLPISEIE